MLETKNLVKIYKPKRGVPFKALDGVSLKFPDRGMVFLLGKSGSGKSTLLNLIGGLDKYNDGEIIIKGVSSKKFRQSHFDSYRNTYVGFIFQEYNILEEFTVGANIALALELQGRKATNEEIGRILHDVDLDGYGHRRPNELSGGQKQRVAIARALVKNPKIIMADEPSGALDSATGKQVFDTLKKLSREKLVIVVSHDRDFASDYADRIIELADGKVVSDTTYVGGEEGASEGITFDGTSAKVPKGYRLTEEDRIAINAYLEKLERGIEIEVEDKKIGRFVPTRDEFIITNDKTPFKLIKSKLSLRHAFKIGSSGLKYKKIRLTFTILLSCIAFVLFGLVDTFSAYNHIKTCTTSLLDSNVNYATVSQYRVVSEGEGIDAWTYEQETLMNAEDVREIEQNTGIKFNGVFTDEYNGLSFIHHIKNQDPSDYSMYQLNATYFSGAAEIDAEILDDMGFEVIAGNLPDGSKSEIAISAHVCDSFIKKGYRYEKDEYEISRYRDMIGKKLVVSGVEYEIAAVIDTMFNDKRYESLYESDMNKDATGQIIVYYVLYNEFTTEVSNSYARMMMFGVGGLQTLVSASKAFMDQRNSEFYFLTDDRDEFYPSLTTTLNQIDKDAVIWLDGERESLGEREILITSSEAEWRYGVYFEIIHDKETESEKLVLVSGKESLDGSYTMYHVNYEKGDKLTVDGFEIVGLINTHLSDSKADMVISNDLFEQLNSKGKGIYDRVVGAMPKDREDIEKLVTYCYGEEDSEIGYTIHNAVCYELDTIDILLETLAKVFVWVGVFFAVFASILLSNFIATSVSYKKQEIGILRAIGSRGNDVFRIFFAESFIIAMINFTLSCIGTGLITWYVNLLIRGEIGLLVTILRFGPRQILILFVISVAVAAVASFLPVKRIASKRPIDAIKDL